MSGEYIDAEGEGWLVGQRTEVGKGRNEKTVSGLRKGSGASERAQGPYSRRKQERILKQQELPLKH